VIEAFRSLQAGAAQARVVCIGDLIVDRYVQGRVARISPEAPIPVLAIDHEYCTAGGAANVAAGIAALGCQVTLVGVVGEDAAAAALTSALAQLGALDYRPVTASGRPTTIKTRYVAGGHQLLRADAETTDAIDPTTAQACLAALQAELTRGSVLVVSDYAKGVLDADLTRSAIELATQRGCLVVVDPKGRDFGKYRGASVLTPNVAELAAAHGDALHGGEAIVQAARTLAQRHGIGHILATRSQDGMSLVAADGTEPLHIPSQAREVFDVSGAGDTVVAVLAAALACGTSLAEAARLANAAAGVAVSKRGTAVVALAELGEAAGEQQAMAVETLFQSREALAAQVRTWQAAGLQVGFTNGCFDLLHAGHLHSLRTARAHCDRLVVAVNSDASVRALKGPSRPVQDEATRAAVLSQLRVSDAVIVFGEDTPQALIEAVAPDVLFKGRDYEGKPVAGAAFVQARGGRLVLVDLVPDTSTTATIERLRGN
jgi:D-beta-D-heptose 7-phosphate kinase/D-beta-D-heptose 1-phosphate adenosyltransferase